MSCQKQKEKFQGYVFTQYGYNGEVTRVKIPTLDITLTDLLRQFAYFLKGCSFHIPHGDNPIIVVDQDDIDE